MRRLAKLLHNNAKKRSLLCKLGLHSWRYQRKSKNSNKRICIKCGLFQKHVQKDIFSDHSYHWITFGHVKNNDIVAFILKWRHEAKRNALREQIWREQYLNPDFNLSNYKPRYGDFEDEIDKRLGKDE